ncbi:MAG TPA: hypothetical protein VE487_20615 [Ilumatobacter sp.]|jgi:hypothetical protein|nr:hypothetical protein [Ilumatobacter sp.]
MPRDEHLLRSERPITSYRIRVRGPLPETLVASLEGSIVGADATTTLVCPIADTSALYGLIARLEALGLHLVSVQPVEGAPD